MSGTRMVVVRRLCPHNESGAHIEVVCVCHAAPAELHSDECRLSWPVCEEGDERELKVGSYVLVEGEWYFPNEVLNDMGGLFLSFLDALAGADHTEGT